MRYVTVVAQASNPKVAMATMSNTHLRTLLTGPRREGRCVRRLVSWWYPRVWHQRVGRHWTGK